jgi:SAM-dependent methyltransferase
MSPPYAPGTREVLRFFLKHYNFKKVLDLGCGVGHLWPELEGKEVMAIDTYPPERVMLLPHVQYVQADFMGQVHFGRVDALFSSHVVEHMQDTKLFLQKFFSFIDDGSPWCIMWPPPQPGIREGHLHHFPMGLMLYNIVVTGIDCSEAMLVRKDYTLGIMGRKWKFELPALGPETRDLTLLAPWFPFVVAHNFPGDNPPGVIDL